MSRDREARATAYGSPLSALRHGLPRWLLPLALLLAALVAALLAGQAAWAGGVQALALLLMFAGALLTGAYWARQRQLDRLREARLSHQLLSQMVDVWCWQTDADHQLVKLQPPQGAPASSWVAGAFSGNRLWQRFDDADHSLQARLQAAAPLGDVAVRQTGPDGQPGRAWRLRGLPRFDSRGRFAGYSGVAWPTEQADAQRRAQQGLDALLRHGPSALCLGLPAAPGPGWRLASANPAALALMGLDSLPTDGLDWDTALAALPGPLATLAASLKPGHDAGKDADNDAWLLRLDSLPGSDAAQRPALLLQMVARAPADGALHQAAAQAAQQAAQQAAAAEQAAFSYTISHDLRAPIRVVEGFGRILKEDYAAALDRVGRDHLDRVMAAAARMNHMIDALLSLSRLSTQPLSQQPVNLSQLAAFVIDDLRRGAPDRTVDVAIAPGLLADGDPTLLRLVLDNLLGNAWKYSAKVAQARICFDAMQQDGRTVFRVADNGAGFDMRFADRLFGVFQRLHSSGDFQGHGVGLASVQRIVKRHGGTVWAEGEVGTGATFFFTLKG